MGHMDCAKRQWRLIGGNLALVQVKGVLCKLEIVFPFYRECF